MKRFLIGSAMSVALGSAAFIGLPQSAQACGGFFCDGGPQPMPVDQSGEDILFVTTGTEVEVHIRVEYEGDPENFAWVIPVQSVPTGFAGSQALFDSIKTASVPTYGILNQADTCGGGTGAGGSGGVGTGSAWGTSGGVDPGPTIFAQESVGAFEITVLGDGTAQELVAWLNDNGYQQDDEALPIIEQYLSEDHKFAAIKLIGGVGVDELHPIALKFDNSEACVPLRLTRIAAVDDMDVRVYFLDQSRVVPSNYRSVLVNPLKIDWSNQGDNYKQVITLAVDAEHADGRAFVTEYAGTSTNVSTFALHSAQWNPAVFENIAPTDVADELVDQGLIQCGWDPNTGNETCAGINPLVGGLVTEYYLPDGVSFYEYQLTPEAYELDLVRWGGGVEFAAKLDERVVQPGIHATELLADNPYLTRMYTTISPHEMTVDPVFYANPDLGEVARSRTGGSCATPTACGSFPTGAKSTSHWVAPGPTSAGRTTGKKRLTRCPMQVPRSFWSIIPKRSMLPWRPTTWSRAGEARIFQTVMTQTAQRAHLAHRAVARTRVAKRPTVTLAAVAPQATRAEVGCWPLG